MNNTPNFTIEQINKAHDTSGNADTLLEYAKALKALGVTHYDSFVTDGHSEYYGNNGYTVTSPAYHEAFTISDTYDEAGFFDCLDLSEDGKIEYVDMSKEFARCGVEKWAMNTSDATFTYYDKAGNAVLVEDLG